MGQWHDLDHDPFAVSSAIKPAEPSGFGSAFAQGFKRSLPETKSLLYGATAALGGAVGAETLRDWGLKHYQRIHDNQVQPLANQHTFQGSIKGEHSLGQWAGDTLGNFAGQGLQSAAAGLAGGVLGGAVSAPAGGVGAVPGSVVGAIGGVVAKEGGKKLIQRQVRQLMKEQLAAGVSRSAARQAGKELAQRRLAQMGGGTLAATGLNIGQEVGIGYSQRAQDAQAAGESLTRQDALRAIAWGIPAGLVDTAAEGLAAGRLLRGTSASGHLPRRMLAGATAGAITEGATEGIQAVMERAGANQSLTDAQAIDDYIENLAAGALGGGAMGGMSGVRRRNEPEPATGQPPSNPATTEPPAATNVPPNAPPAAYLAENSALVRRLLTPDADNSGSLVPTASGALAPITPARPLARRTLTGQLLDPQARLAPERVALPDPHFEPIEAEFTDLSPPTAPPTQNQITGPTAAPEPPATANPAVPATSIANNSNPATANAQTGPLTRALTLHSSPNTPAPSSTAPDYPSGLPPYALPSGVAPLPTPPPRSLEAPAQPRTSPHSPRPLLALPAPPEPEPHRALPASQLLARENLAQPPVPLLPKAVTPEDIYRDVERQRLPVVDRHNHSSKEGQSLIGMAEHGPAARIERYRDATMHDMGIINADNLPKEQVRALNTIARQGYEAAVMDENLNPPKQLSTLERRFWAHGVLKRLQQPEVSHNTETQRHAIVQRRNYEREQAAHKKEQQRQERIAAYREQAQAQRQQELKDRANGILSDEDAQLGATQRWRHSLSAERAAILREIGLDERLAVEHPYLPKAAEQALIDYEKAQFKASRQPKPKAPASAQEQQWQGLSAQQRHALLKQAGATDKQAKHSATYDWQRFQEAAQKKLSEVMQLAPAAPSASPTPTPAHPAQTNSPVPTVKASKQSSDESVVPSLAKRWDTLPKPYRQMYARIVGITKGFYKKWQTLDKEMQESLLEAARRENQAATAWNNADQAQRQDYMKRSQIPYGVDEITRSDWGQLPPLYIPSIIDGYIDAEYEARGKQPTSPEPEPAKPAAPQLQSTVLQVQRDAVFKAFLGTLSPMRAGQARKALEKRTAIRSQDGGLSQTQTIRAHIEDWHARGELKPRVLAREGIRFRPVKNLDELTHFLAENEGYRPHYEVNNVALSKAAYEYAQFLLHPQAATPENNLIKQPVKQGYIRPIPLKLEGWTGTTSELTALAREIYTQDLQGTSAENESLGASIAFTSEGKGEAFGARGRLRSGVRAELVKVLSDLVQSAVKVSQAPPAKGRESDTKAFHTLINALEVNGQVIPVRLTIREAPLVPKGQPAHKFYDIVTHEKSPVVRGLRSDISTAHPPFEALDTKITDLASVFNIGEQTKLEAQTQTSPTQATTKAESKSPSAISSEEKHADAWAQADDKTRRTLLRAIGITDKSLIDRGRLADWKEFIEPGKSLLVQAMAAHAKRQAHIQAAQYASPVTQTQRQAAHPALTPAQLKTLAQYLPIEAAQLNKKPTPAAVRGWIPSPRNDFFATGHLVDFISQPHLSNWQTRMDDRGRNLDANTAKNFREELLKEAQDAIPAQMLAWYTDTRKYEAKAGGVAIAPKSGGEVQYFDLNNLRYFFSKFGDLTAYLHVEERRLYLRNAKQQWVGFTTAYRAYEDRQWQPTVAQINTEIALHHNATTENKPKTTIAPLAEEGNYSTTYNNAKQPLADLVKAYQQGTLQDRGHTPELNAYLARFEGPRRAEISKALLSDASVSLDSGKTWATGPAHRVAETLVNSGMLANRLNTSPTAWNGDKPYNTFVIQHDARLGYEAAVYANHLLDERARKKQPAPPKPPEVQPQKPSSIEDFGEKIGGARKDLAAALKEKISAGDLRSTSFSKLWPLSDIAKIKDDVMAAAVTALRAGVMKRPDKNARDHWFENWAKEIEQARDRATLALQGRFAEAFNTPGPRFDLHNADNIHLEDNYSSAAWHALLLSQLPRQNWPHVKKVRVGLRGLNAVQVGKGYLYPTRGQTFYTFTRQVLKAVEHEQQLASGLSHAFTGWSNKKGEFWFTKDGDTTQTRLIVFDNREAYDAFRKAPDFVAKLNALWEEHKAKHNLHKTDTRSKENRERQGPDWRQGKDITPDEFNQAFGFRGVEFGNWVSKTRERQDGLNRAYDALQDLAQLLNVPTRALSLAGKLGLAFGARGKGMAAAHYEPGRVVINLTKTQGAGSLAHEWFHALDNYFGRTRMVNIAERTGAKANAEFISKAPLEFYVKGSKLIPAKDFEAALAAGRPTADNFKQTARHRWTWQQMGDSAEGWTKLDSVRPEVLHAFEQVVAALNQSPMKARAAKADKGKEGYWSQIIERAARAFENFVIGKLQQQGQRNDYLANVTAFEDFSRDESIYPYLTKDELAPVSAAFDTLFSTLKTRTDDKGNVALFSRSQQDKFSIPVEGRSKADAEEALAKLKGQPLLNYETGIEALINSMQIKKLVSEAAVSKSRANGFTREQHYAIVSHIKTLWHEAIHIVDSLDTKHNDPNVTMRRFAAPIQIADQTHYVVITAKQTVQFGSRIYTLEAHAEKTLRGTLEDLSSGKPGTSISPSFRSVNEIIEALNAKVNPATPKQSRNPSIQPQRQRLADVVAQAASLARHWPNAPEIIVASDLSDRLIPEAVRRENTRQQRQDATGSPEGFYYQGKVYLIASQLKSDADVARVLFHEVLGHVGLRGAFGSTLTPILKELANARRVEIAAKLKQYGLTDTPANRLIAAEEVLAELAQSKPQLNLVQRAMAAIRSWLRQHIPALRHLPLSDHELIRNYILPARTFVERSTPAAQARSQQRDTPAFERGKVIPIFDLDNLPSLRPARTFKEARQAAKAFQGKPLTNQQTGMVAVVSRTNLDKMLSGKAVSKSESPALQSTAVANIDSLFKQAVWGWSKPDRAIDSNIKAIHRFFAPMDVDGRIKMVKLTIKEIAPTQQTNTVYTVEAVDFANGGKQWLETAALEDGISLEKKTPQRGEWAVEIIKNDPKTTLYGFLPEGSAAEAVLNLAQAIEQHNTQRASEGPLFSRSTPETVIGTINQAVKGPRGPAWARVKQLFSNLNPKHLRENTRPAWLGALTLRHLAELGKDIGLKQVNDYANLVQTMATLRNSLQDSAAQTADQWEKFQRQQRTQADAMANLMFDATLASVDPDASYQPLSVPQAQYGQQVFEQEDLTPAAFRARRRAIHAALQRARGQNRQVLLDQRQQLNTRWQQEKARLRAWPALQKRFAALPETGQRLYRQVRDSYREQSSALEQALIARIEALITDGNTRAATLARMRQQFESARLRGPYFPLQRFGTFWIHATDKHGEPAFMMYETVQAWQQAQRDLKAEGFSIQQAGRKLEDASQLRGSSGSFITDLQHLLERHGSDPALRDEVYQLYLRTLPDVSLRKHYLHRKGTAGYNRDALRAFSANLFHGSFQIARLQFSHQLDSTLQAMKAQVKQLAKTDAERAAKAATLYSEMGKRHDWVMNPRDSKAANTLTSLGFAWYLGATPAAALVNLSQTAIVSLPVLAAKFGSAKALKALTDTMALSLRSQTGDLRTRLNSEERAAYQQWHAMGTIDKSQAHNLAGLSETDSHAFNPHARRAMHLISWLFHRAEVVNREATALAAYRLARQNGMEHPAAVSYGHDAVMESHFDYSNANRARWMQSNAAKVLLLFRQYSLNMTWFLWRNLYQSLQGQDAQTKKEARTKLMGVLGMTGLFSGVMGLPLMSVLFSVADAAAAALGDDDDDPFDSKVAFRNFLADYLGKRQRPITRQRASG